MSSSAGPLVFTEACPPYAPFLSFAGAATSIIFCSMGAAYGTAKAGVTIAGVGTFKPKLIMKALMPIVMAGIISIYGLVISVLISGSLDPKRRLSLATATIHLGAGLTTGLAGLASGWCIGIVGDAFVHGLAKEPRLFVGMVLILIFSEVLGLLGMIIALIMSTQAATYAELCDVV